MIWLNPPKIHKEIHKEREREREKHETEREREKEKRERARVLTAIVADLLAFVSISPFCRQDVVFFLAFSSFSSGCTFA